MIYTDIHGMIDLAKGVQLTHLKTPFVTEDSKAHRILVAVHRDTACVDLAGVTVTGSFVRADGVTVSLTGEVRGNVAIVTLMPACYREEGRCVLAIKATIGDVVSTIFLADGVVMRSSTDSVVTDEETALSLEQLFQRLDAGVASVENSAEIAAQAANDAQVALGGADAVARAEAAAAEAEEIISQLKGIDMTVVLGRLAVLEAATTPTVLWDQGDDAVWESGSRTANGIGEWYLLDIITNVGHVIATNDGSAINGSSTTRYGTTDGHQTIVVAIDVSGDTMTLSYTNRLRHKMEDNHSALPTQPAIKRIVGLLKRSMADVQSGGGDV